VPTWTTDTGTRFDLYRLMSIAAERLGDRAWCNEIGGRGSALVDREYGSSAFGKGLQDIVDDAIMRSRTRCEVSPPANLGSAPSRLGRPLRWPDIAPAVEAYTSVNLAVQQEFRGVYPWPGRFNAADQAYAFDDPAWPTPARLRSDEAALLPTFGSSNWGLPRLELATAGDSARFERLVRRGVLAWTDRP
jgi:hypothetical protein